NFEGRAFAHTPLASAALEHDDAGSLLFAGVTRRTPNDADAQLELVRWTPTVDPVALAGDGRFDPRALAVRADDPVTLAIGVRPPESDAVSVTAGESVVPSAPLIESIGRGDDTVHRIAHAPRYDRWYVAWASGELSRCNASADNCVALPLLRRPDIGDAGDIHDVRVVADRVVATSFDGHVWVFDDDAASDAPIAPFAVSRDRNHQSIASAALGQAGGIDYVVIGTRGPVMGRGCITVFRLDQRAADAPLEIDCQANADNAFPMENLSSLAKINWIDAHGDAIAAAYNGGLQFLRLSMDAPGTINIAAMGADGGARADLKGRRTEKYWKIAHVGQSEGRDVWAAVSGRAVMSLWLTNGQGPFYTIPAPSHPERLTNRNAILDFTHHCDSTQRCQFFFASTKRGVYRHALTLSSQRPD
ncbi:MAG: hypothetical protein AAFU65_12945, partial [Pseudomonadota bacterium]